MSTQRQKLAASKLVEFGGNMGKAMVAAGYSPATAKTPQKLTERKGWGAIMENLMPELKVAKIQAGLLEANQLESKTFPLDYPNSQIKSLIEAVTGSKVKLITKSGTIKTVYYISDDRRIQKEALEMYHKLRGNFAPEKVIDTAAQDKLEEVRNEIKEFINAA